jgi:hypothetical protein
MQALADEGEVVTAARGIGNRGASVDRHVERGGVEDVAAVNGRIRAEGIADSNRVADVATGVDVADGDGTAVRGGGCHTAVAGGGDVFVAENAVEAASAAPATLASPPTTVALMRLFMRLLLIPAGLANPGCPGTMQTALMRPSINAIESNTRFA